MSLEVDDVVFVFAKPSNIAGASAASAADTEPPPDQDFTGTIKSLSERHGYGFVACEEVHRIYGRDTYLAKAGNSRVARRLSAASLALGRI
eukprot:g7173.t1